ncbi:hypothetical protein JMUB3934_0495 [Leptotrichia wadei]|uniref:Uncharacterized protein n=1 Tax=Leptotrichia wadei TaxID=157687 RepID=A0A510KCL2_9FUSO|nr:hypothetical protein JMUB3934_0167 [Leptotrichia wadei]BBM49200.1 hypothetical protein JMUB3934_0495 [Leptotrichia wadei]
MIRISDFSSLVKTFFKNIFSFRLPFEQQFKLFVSKTFETLFRVYVKRVDDAFFIPMKEKINLKAKDLLKELLPLLSGMSLLNVANM